MIFTSLAFLAFYAVLMLLLAAVKGNTARQFVLLAASYFFYGWWNPAFIVLIFASSLWGWYFGLLMDRTSDERKRTLYLSLSLTLSLGMLAYFKYAEFLVGNLLFLFGIDWDHDFDIILPIGISFFTFQTMSYGIDLKRGRISVCNSLPQFMLFVAFFPQLVAGPIVRASEFLPQLANQIRITKRNLIVGAQIFLGGAIQKVLFADNLSVFVDPVFDQPELFSSSTLWLAMLSYAMQIFCDFSGYSLMAIGVARTLGFQLPDNFRMPYLASSITDFWRRWHMTLSFWLRDYLYVSLGGNRKGPARTYAHLLITMLLGGLWHGASWNFVVWGALHGIALLVHKLWTVKTARWEDTVKAHSYYRFFAWCATFLFVALLWLPFRCNSFTDTRNFVANLFGNTSGIEWINPNIVLILITVAAWHLLYLYQSRLLLGFPEADMAKSRPQFVVGLVLLLMALFAPLNTSPFVYFQF